MAAKLPLDETARALAARYLSVADTLAWRFYKHAPLIGDESRSVAGLINCGVTVPLPALGDVGAAAGHDLDQALVGEYPDGLAGGQPRDLVPLHELGLGRHRAAGRVDAALDLVAQDRCYLQVDRRLALMINRHVVKLPG